MREQSTATSRLNYVIQALEAMQTAQAVDNKSMITKVTDSGNNYDFSVSTTTGQQLNRLVTVSSGSGEDILMQMSYWFAYTANVLSSPVIGVGVGLPVTVNMTEGVPTKGKRYFYFSFGHSPTTSSNYTTYVKLRFAANDELSWAVTNV